MSKFRILWIDDQTAKCKRDSIAVKNIIQEIGFEPDIVFEDRISKDSLVDESGDLNKAIKARNTDLYIVDYQLKDNVFGSDIIREIRKENKIYTDIIFYSSDAKTLLSEVKNSFEAPSSMDYFDGVYITPLGDEFISKVEYVINKIICSWYNVHSIRGVTLSKASKFEHLASRIILDRYNLSLSSIKEKLAEKGNNVVQTLSDKWKKVSEQADPIPGILKDPISFNWAVKKLILIEMMDKNIITLETWDDIVDIFNLRNDFAHNPIHLENGILIVDKPKGSDKYDEDDVIRIREKLTRIEKELLDFTEKQEDDTSVSAS